jgi:hypothetical protein
MTKRNGYIARCMFNYNLFYYTILLSFVDNKGRIYCFSFTIPMDIDNKYSGIKFEDTKWVISSRKSKDR